MRSNKLIKPSKKEVEIFINKFFGFGSWEGKYWFIGVEPGGGAEVCEAYARINCFDSSKEQLDSQSYHSCIDNLAHTHLFDELFGDNAHQRTWEGIVRILLIAEGTYLGKLDSDIRTIIRNFLRNNIGRAQLEKMRMSGRDTSHCLIEFSPFSVSHNIWHYKQLLDKTRDEIFFDCTNKRLSVLADRFHSRKNKPKAIIFYGVSESKFLRAYNVLLEKFSKCSSYEIKRNEIDGNYIETTQIGTTCCILMKHPAYVSNEYLSGVGKYIQNIQILP